MSVFLDILHRAAARKGGKTDEATQLGNIDETTQLGIADTRREPVEKHTEEKPGRPDPGWPSLKAEMIAGGIVVLLFILLLLVTQLGDALGSISSGSRFSTEVEDYDEDETEMVVPAGIDGTYTLSGTVQRAGGIEMHLTIDGTRVTGNYGYASQGYIPIALQGDIERDGDGYYISLYELTDYGERVGRISGTFDGTDLEGDYYNFNSGRHFDVNAYVTSR